MPVGPKHQGNVSTAGSACSPWPTFPLATTSAGRLKSTCGGSSQRLAPNRRFPRHYCQLLPRRHGNRLRFQSEQRKVHRPKLWHRRGSYGLRVNSLCSEESACRYPSMRSRSGPRHDSIWLPPRCYSRPMAARACQLNRQQPWDFSHTVFDVAVSGDIPWLVANLYEGLGQDHVKQANDNPWEPSTRRTPQLGHSQTSHCPLRLCRAAQCLPKRELQCISRRHR